MTDPYVLSALMHDFASLFPVTHCHLKCLYRPQDIVAATAALEEIRESTKFSEILELILLMGNYMNAGSRNAQSLGFEISYITKVLGWRRDSITSKSSATIGSPSIFSFCLMQS